MSDATWHEVPEFSADVTDDGHTQVVRLVGELDIASTSELRDVLVNIARSEVVVDLSGLTFIDAAGLSALMVARRTLTSGGQRFAITGASGLVRRVFELTDLAHFLD